MRVWIVSSARAGTLTQCLGVAQHLDDDPLILRCERKLKFYEVGPLSPHRPFPAERPDVLISCGTISERHARSIALRFRRRPDMVHLQTPRETWADRYRLAYISRHDWSEDKARHPNFRPMIGVPHRITAGQLAVLRPEARRRFAPGERPVVTVLIGGTNGAYAFDGPAIERLIGGIESFAASGWRVLVSTSRRSEPVLLARLTAIRNEHVHVWGGDGDNPYLDFLAAADAFLVTKDTITMHCEALASGRPVHTFDLPRMPDASLDRDKLQSFETFHRDMSETLRLTRPFRGTIEHYAYEIPDEARRIAAEIEACVGVGR